MYTGRVAGTLTATVKDENLEGIPLLVVRTVENGRDAGLIVATDATRQAGIGDFVYLIGSKEAGRVFRKPLTPTDASIVGFIDHCGETPYPARND